MHADFRERHGSRPCDGARAERAEARGRASPFGSPAFGRGGGEADVVLHRHVRVHDGRLARLPDGTRRLCFAHGEGSPHARRGRVVRLGVRREGLCDAHLDRPRAHDRARRLDGGDRGRDFRAEPPVRAGRRRRGRGEQRADVQAHDARTAQEGAGFRFDNRAYGRQRRHREDLRRCPR